MVMMMVMAALIRKLLLMMMLVTVMMIKIMMRSVWTLFRRNKFRTIHQPCRTVSSLYRRARHVWKHCTFVVARTHKFPGHWLSGDILAVIYHVCITGKIPKYLAWR